MRIQERFEKYVSPEPNTGCYLWIGSLNTYGYGQFWCKGKNVLAHRASFELYKSLIPPGISVLHACDNPACVNPDHLFLGTQKDNMQDMKKKGRCWRGSNYVHHKRSLNYQQALEVHKLSKKISNREISRRLGVSRTVIDNIVNGSTYLDVNMAHQETKTKETIHKSTSELKKPRITREDFIQQLQKIYRTGLKNIR